MARESSLSFTISHFIPTSSSEPWIKKRFNCGKTPYPDSLATSPRPDEILSWGTVSLLQPSPFSFLRYGNTPHPAVLTPPLCSHAPGIAKNPPQTKSTFRISPTPHFSLISVFCFFFPDPLFAFHKLLVLSSFSFIPVLSSAKANRGFLMEKFLWLQKIIKIYSNFTAPSCM